MLEAHALHCKAACLQGKLTYKAACLKGKLA